MVGSERALLVDTGSSPAQGAAVRASVAAVTDRPLSAVAVTHWHYDHAFGLAAFADLLTIGHESVRGRLGSAEARAEALRLGVDAADLVAPGRELAMCDRVGGIDTEPDGFGPGLRPSPAARRTGLPVGQQVGERRQARFLGDRDRAQGTIGGSAATEARTAAPPGPGWNPGICTNSAPLGADHQAEVDRLGLGDGAEDSLRRHLRAAGRARR